MKLFYGTFFSPPSGLTAAEQAELKKEAYGIRSKDEIHKFSMGFFLDQFEGIGAERKAVDRLSRFEWFSGSISAERLAFELTFFLKTDYAQKLDTATQKQLQIVIKLLQDAHEQSSAVDIVRSGSLTLALLAITGKQICARCTYFSADEKDVSKLATNAHTKIMNLKVGEKALFLTGTLIHETLLLVEKKDQELWEVAYYDTGNEKPLSVFIVEAHDALIFTKGFWKEIYNCKFKRNATNQLSTYIYEIGKRVSRNLIKYAELSEQKKNTCHIRSLLAVVKDHIVRHSNLDLNLALIEWKKFEVLFGQYLIEGNVIENQKLLNLARIEQTNRNALFEQVVKALDAYTQVCGDYHHILSKFWPNRATYAPKPETPPIVYLYECHHMLIITLERFVLSEGELENLNKNKHALVAYTLSVIAQRSYKRARL